MKYIFVGKRERDFLMDHCIEGKIRWFLKKQGVRVLVVAAYCEYGHGFGVS
jgi:hypothetical protein